MSTDTITLFVITEDEQNSWLKKLTYSGFSPRHDNPVDLIRANRVAEKSRELDLVTRIRVNSEATVSDVIAEARHSIMGYEEDFKVAKIKEGLPYGYPIEYRLYHSAFAGELESSMRISELGLSNNDLVIIRKSVRDREGVHAPMTLSGVSSFKRFQDTVWGSEDPSDPMLLAALLYTDEDIDLAKYVREHFDELHRMSGPRVIAYVVEHPPKDSALGAPLFWKSLLDESVYRAWSLLGWTQSRPYNKTSAYEIARSLGIYPDQLPCLAVFDRTGQAEKIVFPVSGDFTIFFRRTFSNMQHALYLGPGRDIWDKEERDRERLKLFEKIRESLNVVQTDTEDQRTVCNFYGQTVFINRPTGLVRLQDFQNT